jgi:hypothetical protein
MTFAEDVYSLRSPETTRAGRHEELQMKRTIVGVLVAVTALFAMGGVPAGAITYGQPDAGEHPYVGFMIYFVPSEPGWFSCTGTLLDEDTLLTAGHCVYDVGVDGADVDPSGGTDMWVTFDETETLAGWPARADYPDEETLYAARRAWLESNPLYTSGTAIPSPDYDDFASFPVTFDVGVVELDEAQPMETYGVLAPIGTAELLAAPAKSRNRALVETVGYGTQSVQPHPAEVESRFKSTSRIVEVNGNQASGGNLHTLNNPSKPGGVGGSCFGDSGGPVFVNNTNQVVSVVSYGPSATCHGADYSWRVDTVDAYEFIGTYVDLTDA